MKKHPIRIVMSGYYGFRNAGDDAVGKAIIQALQQEIPDCAITVLSNDVETTRLQYGVDAVSRWQPLKVMRAILPANVVVSGGGSLIQDVTSRHGCLYYLAVIFMAQVLRRPVVIYSQGLGPLNGALNRRLTALAFNHAKAVFVRDKASAQLAKEIGVRRQVRVVPDPVLAMEADPSLQDTARRALEKLGRRTDRPLALLALREWPDIDRVADFAALCDELDRRGYEVGLLSMHYDKDAAIAKAVAGRTQAHAFVINEDWDTDMFLAVIDQADLVVGMRLHALIMGAALGKRLLAVSYDPKVEAFMRMLQNADCLDLDAVSAGTLMSCLDHALTAPHDQERGRVALLKRFCLLPAAACARIVCRP
jgi:polysaccharide pyruvyl transferase CsaB